MFADRVPHRADDEQNDIFAPVADLMVGVVFIFIILILALSLDLSTEQTVPKSTYDVKVQENTTLARELSSVRALLEKTTSALNDKRTRRVDAERRATRLSVHPGSS